MGWTLQFEDGTLVVRGAQLQNLPSAFVWDKRIEAPRGPGYLYPAVVYKAMRDKIPFEDEARSWEKQLNMTHRVQREARDYQREAVQSWLDHQRRGVVVLPTGSGKSFVAELCMAQTKRSTMIIAPTLDLVGQWYDRMRLAFSTEVGILGGGFHDIQDITVSTYDSAYLHLPRYGDRFAMLIYDEVHHLPAQASLDAAKLSMAPFRLGLTATLEREDGRERLLDSILGPVVYRKQITELSGNYLADYEVQRIFVELSEEEKHIYDRSRADYISFLKEKQISMGGGGWKKFIQLAARSKRGREAFQSYHRSKKISHGAQSKIDMLERILRKERGRRTIIFTNDNSTAYTISQRFLIPCITHHSDVKERQHIISSFASGDYTTVVTSRVLNEGVDIPAAEVGIVLSGTGTVREHVQRLGRILRPAEGKKALMYELVSAGTAEQYTSQRRRNHDAYR